MTQKSALGKFGEDVACEYLMKKGWKIIGRNIRRKFGEIDVLARERNGTIVFVEVKTMIDIGDEFLKPEDNFTPSKLKKFKKISISYLNEISDEVNEKFGWRIDLVTIRVREVLTDKDKDCDINHWENVA